MPLIELSVSGANHVQGQGQHFPLCGSSSVELKARVCLGCVARGSVAHGIASAKSVRRSAPPQLLNRQVSQVAEEKNHLPLLVYPDLAVE